jgi:hypothetical protein
VNVSNYNRAALHPHLRYIFQGSFQSSALQGLNQQW